MQESERYRKLRENLVRRRREAEENPDEFYRECAIELVESKEDRVARYEKALAGLVEGTYGICAGCRRPIDEKRLLALPLIRICQKCEEDATVRAQVREHLRTRRGGELLRAMGE